MRSEEALAIEPDAESLANEIYHVYNEIRAVIPDVCNRIGRAEPTWILLEAEKSTTEKQATMRDYVLHRYATVQNNMLINKIKERAAACPLSFDVASNPAIFDIDHFHSRAEIGQTAENYCNARADLLVRSFVITKNCLKNTPEYQAGVKAIFKCMSKALDRENGSISSLSDLELPAIDLMSATRDHLDHVVSKHKRKQEDGYESTTRKAKKSANIGGNSSALFSRQSRNSQNKNLKSQEQSKK